MLIVFCFKARKQAAISIAAVLETQPQRLGSVQQAIHMFLQTLLHMLRAIRCVSSFTKQPQLYSCRKCQHLVHVRGFFIWLHTSKRICVFVWQLCVRSKVNMIAMSQACKPLSKHVSSDINRIRGVLCSWQGVRCPSWCIGRHAMSCLVARLRTFATPMFTVGCDYGNFGTTMQPWLRLCTLGFDLVYARWPLLCTFGSFLLGTCTHANHETTNLQYSTELNKMSRLGLDQQVAKTTSFGAPRLSVRSCCAHPCPLPMRPASTQLAGC